MATPPLNTADREIAQLPGMFQRYRPHISKALRQGLERDGVGVYHMLRYSMGWVDVEGSPTVAAQGKALRPTLCLLGSEAAGGTIDAAMPAAVALEFIHNFSLIHDDIQDRDRTRHHRPTLWAVWDVPKALVAGNVLRVVADTCLEGLTSRGVESGHALGVISLLTEAYLEMIEGQYLDISYEGQPDISIDDYMTMISRKTGALIRCALHLGALIGTGDTGVAEAFRECGRSLGYVFQIRDDYLGVWGDEGTTGKPVGADIRRKKNSFPVVCAMSQSSGRDQQLLKELYGKADLDDGDVAQVLEVMEGSRVKERAMSIASEHSDRAIQALSDVEIAPTIRQDIDDLVHFLLVRQH